MVQFRVITKTSGTDQVLNELPDQMAQIKRDVMESMAADIANASPVYRGTYVTSHQVRLRSGSFTANKTRPEGTPKVSEGEAARLRQQGFENMLRDIAAVNIKSDNFVFRNPMAYASIVEGDYGVYAQARKTAGQAVQDAIQKARRRG